MEIDIFTSMMSTETEEKFREKIEKVFAIEPTFHSSIFALNKSLQTLFVDEDNLVIVDNHAEMTEIGIVREDILQQFGTFPLGQNQIIREIQNKLKLENIEQAQSMFNLFLAKKIDKSLYTKVKEVVDKFKSEWFEFFAKTLEELAKKENLPEKIFINTHRSTKIIKTSLILENKLNGLTKRHEPFTEIEFNDVTLRQYLDSPKNSDKALSLMTIYAQLLIQA